MDRTKWPFVASLGAEGESSWFVAVNVLKEQSLTVDEGWSLNLGLGQGALTLQH